MTDKVGQSISILLARNHVWLVIRHSFVKILGCRLGGGCSAEGRERVGRMAGVMVINKRRRR